MVLACSKASLCHKTIGAAYQRRLASHPMNHLLFKQAGYFMRNGNASCRQIPIQVGEG